MDSYKALKALNQEKNSKKHGKSMSYTEKLQKLREVLKEQGLGGFLVPRTDEYQGEYVPPHAERLAWLTGFTGSAGLAVILAETAVVMSDGRYTIQLAAQVDEKLYQVENSQRISPDDWLKKNVPEGAVIGYDPKLHTPAQIEAKEKAGLILKEVQQTRLIRYGMISQNRRKVKSYYLMKNLPERARQKK